MTHVLEIELVSSLKHFFYGNRLIWVEVDEFYEFLHILYKTYASLSRRSEPETMRTRITCYVEGVKFYVWVADGGLRYCRA